MSNKTLFISTYTDFKMILLERGKRDAVFHNDNYLSSQFETPSPSNYFWRLNLLFFGATYSIFRSYLSSYFNRVPFRHLAHSPFLLLLYGYSPKHTLGTSCGVSLQEFWQVFSIISQLPVRATFYCYLIIVCFIMLITFYKDCKLWSSYFCTFCSLPVSSTS